MSRENDYYRDNLESLLDHFGGKRVLSVMDVSRYTGRDRRWCQKTYNIDADKGISIQTLARKLSEAAI